MLCSIKYLVQRASVIRGTFLRGGTSLLKVFMQYSWPGRAVFDTRKELLFA